MPETRKVIFQGGPFHNRYMEMAMASQTQVLFPLAPDVRFIEDDIPLLPSLKAARYIRSGMKMQRQDGVFEVWTYDGVVD